MKQLKLNYDTSKSTAASNTETFSYKGQEYDYLFQSMLGRFTNWLSPASYFLAFTDWAMDLTLSPARQIDILNKAATNYYQLMQYSIRSFFNQNCEVCTYRKLQDRRFENELWGKYPFIFT